MLSVPVLSDSGLPKRSEKSRILETGFKGEELTFLLEMMRGLMGVVGLWRFDSVVLTFSRAVKVRVMVFMLVWRRTDW